MNRIFSYCFIFLILLNVVGYNGLFFGIRYHHERTMKENFDNGNFESGSVVTMKIPIALPYTYDGLDFDRVDGEFEYSGDLYRLVEKKLEADTLTVICVRDDRHQQINNAFKSYAKELQSTSSGDKTSGSHTAHFTKDYVQQNFSLLSNADGWSICVEMFFLSVKSVVPYQASISVPPEKFLS
jgi:hypothetical protein